jgi:hypothetical protein
VAQVNSHVRAAAAALLLAVAATGCQRTTEGSVAVTTEPGPPLSTPEAPTGLPSIPGLPDLPELPFPIPGLPGADVPEVPPPANATTLRCREFNDLDEPTRRAVIRANLGEREQSSPEAVLTATLIATALCQLMPDLTVREAITGVPG